MSGEYSTGRGLRRQGIDGTCRNARFVTVLIGYGPATLGPSVTKHIEKLIILVIFLSLLPGIITHLKNYLANRNAKPPTRQET